MITQAKKFEVLERGPDLKFKVFGSSPRELFKNALYVLGYTQKPEMVQQSAVGALIGRLRGKRITEDFSVESMDYNTLLVDFLSDVLARSDSQNAVFFDVKFTAFSENKIEGRIYGVKVGDFSKNVKAVSYHEIDIKEPEPGKWESLMVLDI
ncbi:MAG: archease [Parcubacteria group bacterium]|nr:archease [Parcubacteria group bacterium]